MIDVCIIGFGISSIALIRELKRTGTQYLIISGEDDSVWDRLSEKGQLSFNLVSSYHTSFYSFDLTNSYEGDFYPSAQQFFEMLKRWRRLYGPEVVRDCVVRVDSCDGCNVVTTRSGKTYEAKHVVVATGFDRFMNQFLANFDYGVANKTFVFGTMGDSVNMMISKLVPNNNKVIIRMGGFTALDQEIQIGNTPAFALDQFEFHNMRYVAPDVFTRTLMHFVYPDNTRHPAVLFNQFPLVRRDFSWVRAKDIPPNGLLAIKYWPIDHYARKFGGDLEGNIRRGYLLNDIAMWLHTGRVIIVPADVPLDLERKTIRYAGVERSFDEYIKGDVERPRLPEIYRDGRLYEHRYRDTFMGVIPRSLRNVYFLGFTRPFTGGLANIAEMQSLFIHKMIASERFRSEIHSNLGERIAAYTKYYYGDARPRGTDHVVVYGLYTDDIARLLGIDHRPEDCRSLRDLMFYYAFPNNAFKYRIKGAYAVEGVSDLIEKVKGRLNLTMFFSFLLKVSTVEPGRLGEWFDTAYRFLFNDMRFKDSARGFLDRYIQTYRRVYGSHCEAAGVDAEWEEMGKHASADRDRAMAELRTPDNYQMTEDLFREMTRLELLADCSLKSLLDPADPAGAQLDDARRAALARMWHPLHREISFL